MARHVISLNAFEGSVASMMRCLSQYPADARIRLETGTRHNGMIGEFSGPEEYQFYVVEFDEFARTIKDAEIERSWRESWDRMGGQFTDQEVYDSLDPRY